MDISQYIIGLIIMLISILVIDLVWLAVLAKDLYRRELKGLMLDKPKVSAAGLFYVLFAMGALYFVVSPAVVAQDSVQALLRGGLYGFFGYQLYDLTNYATLKNWPKKLVVIDIIWGTFLTATVSFITTALLLAF